MDSIDVDFQPEVGWKENSVYPYQDWDLQFGYDKWSNNHVAGSGRANRGVGKTGEYAWHDHLRIHSTIDFGEAYPVRQRVKDKDSTDRDMLWVRIESEPMLVKPDALNGYTTTNLKSGNGIFVLNSVRQLIITNSASNTGDNDRPIVIFYDGPERYSTDNHIRDANPVILNLRHDINAILYMPDCPVVILEDGKNISSASPKHTFNGFIVAKKYLRLKTAEDFEKEIDKYDKVDDNGKIFASGTNYREKATTQNAYYREIHTLKDSSPATSFAKTHATTASLKP